MKPAARPRLEELQPRTVPAAVLADINPGAGSSNPGVVGGGVLFDPLVADVNGVAFFVADNGTSGVELWKSDGTAAGTVLVKDINPGAGGSKPGYSGSYSASGLVNVNGTLFFAANDGTHGVELWKSDGTAAGTVLVEDINPGVPGTAIIGLTNVSGTLFFAARSPGGYNVAVELWKSDGTAAGTDMVKDINPTTGSYPSNLTNVNGTLFFGANDGTNGVELWKSDGTAGGTILVKDINPGAGDSKPGFSAPYAATGFVNVGGTVFFAANDGTHGAELWKSDGTAAGTVLVKDIDPSATSKNVTSMEVVGTTVFFGASDGTNGFALWKTDGTTAGTVLVKDVNTATGLNPNYGTPYELTNVNGTLFFAGRDASLNGTALELWKSDGTTAGTVLVEDIFPGTTGSYPRYLVNLGGKLYFTADDGVNGPELWQSDGTVAGTALVQDIIPEPTGTYQSDRPRRLGAAGGTLFFAADDKVSGSELWAFSTAPPDVAGAKVTSATFSGTAAGTFDKARVTFSEPMNPATFTADDVGSFVEPGGGNAIPVMNVVAVAGSNNTQFDVTFPVQTLPGVYSFQLGVNITDAAGNQLNQDGDASNGEDLEDQFTATGTLGASDTTGARVSAGVFSGTAANTFDRVRVTFSEAINPASFTPDDVGTATNPATLTGPNGLIAVTGVTPVAGTNNAFDVAFAPQTVAGTYSARIRVAILDLAGNPLDANENGINGEAGDVPTGDHLTLTSQLTGGTTDKTGAKVLSGEFLGDSTGTFNRARVTFNEPMNPAEFTAADVGSFVEPGGGNAIPVTNVVAVAGSNNTQFDVTFPVQTLPGVYSFQLGVNITDAAGNQLNQDGDAFNGEDLEDRFTVVGKLSGGGTVGFPADAFVVGTVDGTIQIIDATAGTVVRSGLRTLDGFARYTGLVSVAVGDLNGDGTPDIFVAAANPSGAAGLDPSKAGRVFVYDGGDAVNGTLTLIRTFTPFATTDGPAGNTAPYINGLNISVGDVTGDGVVDLIAGSRGGNGTPTGGNREVGRLVVINGTGADGVNAVVGGIQKPFGGGYEKGVVVDAGNADGVGGLEVAVTRGGPVASPNPAVQQVKLKVLQLRGAALTELPLGVNGETAFAPFAAVSGPASAISRDARVAFMDTDGNGREELVFTALDPFTSPTNQQVRVDVFDIDTTAALGAATVFSAGTYTTGTAVVDHAITQVAGVGLRENLALLTQSADSGIVYLAPLNSVQVPGGLDLTIAAGGITIDGI